MENKEYDILTKFVLKVKNPLCAILHNNNTIARKYYYRAVSLRVWLKQMGE